MAGNRCAPLGGRGTDAPRPSFGGIRVTSPQMHSLWPEVSLRRGGRPSRGGRAQRAPTPPALPEFESEWPIGATTVRPSPAWGMTVDRVAGRRGRPDKVLALDDAVGDLDGDAGTSREGTMADRARLRGAEAGVRPLPVHRTRVARVLSPRDPLHRPLRMLGGRTGPAFPPPRPLAFLHAVRLPTTYRPRGSPGPS